MDQSIQRKPSTLAKIACLGGGPRFEHAGRWCEWKHGKPITQNSLARQLQPFGLVPGNLRLHGQVMKSYRLEQFRDAFARYIPIPPDPSATPLRTAETQRALALARNTGQPLGAWLASLIANAPAMSDNTADIAAVTARLDRLERAVFAADTGTAGPPAPAAKRKRLSGDDTQADRPTSSTAPNR